MIELMLAVILAGQAGTAIALYRMNRRIVRLGHAVDSIIAAADEPEREDWRHQIL